MAELNKHWTEKSTEDFMYRIGADFVAQIERVLGKQSKASLARKLGVSAGRISQVLNNPGNLRLKTMIEYARALGLKISVVTYNDNDPNNLNGPVDAEIFVQCWIRTGRPLDFFALQACTVPTFEQLRYVFKPSRQVAAIAGEFHELTGEFQRTAGTDSGQICKWDQGGFNGRSDTARI